jgi:hypothetical protein
MDRKREREEKKKRDPMTKIPKKKDDKLQR